MTLQDTQILLDEIRGYKDLETYKKEQAGVVCEKHNISEMQLNFLVSVVAAERHKEQMTNH
jgi:hypothetical protein